MRPDISTPQNDKKGIFRSIFDGCALGCLGIMLIPLVLLLVLFSSIVGHVCAIIMVLFFFVVILIFMYSHPANTYSDFLERQKWYKGLSTPNIHNIIEKTIYVSVIAIGVAVFAFLCPTVIKECSLDQSYIPFHIGEIAACYFVFVFLVARALEVLQCQNGSFDKSKENISDLLCISQDPESLTEEIYTNQSQLSNDKKSLDTHIFTLPCIGTKHISPKKKANFIFMGIYMIFVFTCFFIHQYLMSSFYLENSYGVYIFGLFLAMFSFVSLWLNRKFSVR